MANGVDRDAAVVIGERVAGFLLEDQ